MFCGLVDAALVLLAIEFGAGSQLTVVSAFGVIGEPGICAGVMLPGSVRLGEPCGVD